jgi:TolB-like protein
VVPPERQARAVFAWSPTVMTESSRAVFLSYASQDAGAARRICEALRAAGIEVWFDQSELRGGDAWDAAIRRQIKNCALFIPVISGNTHAREEGYFRLEWKLAVDRSHLMTTNRTFLLPVAIDQTGDDDEQVPDRFRELQWTRLPAGETPPAFVERVLRLLAPAHHPLPVAAPLPEASVQATGSLPAIRAPISLEATQSVRPTAKFRFSWVLVAAAVIVAIGYLAISRWSLNKHSIDAGQGSLTTALSAAPAQNAIPEKSIAVLPFVDMSEKHDQEYFSDGLTEELLDLLSQVPDLHVPARTSSFYFKGKAEDVATIAQKLRVAHVLEGSVRKAGTTIRITAQLIRADNGYHLWSKAYDRDVKDIFKVQDEIAAEVVEALKAKLLPTQELANRHRTANTEAYTQYLLGNQFRLRDSQVPNQLALEAYKKAVALDPDYAAAYSGVSDTEWRIADQTTGEAAGYERAAAAADKAIQLAPDSPEGYWARGQLRNSYYFDWQGAQADFEKALVLDPNYVQASVDEALLLATTGHMQEGVEMLRKAVALDPMSVQARRRLAWLLMHSGQFSEAREAISRVLDINPQGDPLFYASQLEILTGRPREALAALPGVDKEGENIVRSLAEYSLGHAPEAQRSLDFLLTHHANVWGYQIAEVYAWRGERDKAFEWLERSYRQRDGGLTYMIYDRWLANLRGDPRYRALLRKLKLSD